MPDVPDPETLQSESAWRAEIARDLPEKIRDGLNRPRPFEFRSVHPRNRFGWRRARSPPDAVGSAPPRRYPDDDALHRCVLAYASDLTLLDMSLLAHGFTLFTPGLQLASLDHAMWFHRPFRADDWLLYVPDSPSASGGRGFNRGEIFRRDGALVASTAQEGLIRVRS